MSRVMYLTGDLLIERGHTVDYLFSEEIDAGPYPQLHRFIAPFKVLRAIRDRSRNGQQYDVVEIHEPIAMAYALGRRQFGLPPLVVFSHGLEERGLRSLLEYHAKKQLPVSVKQRYSPQFTVWQSKMAIRRAQHSICLNEEDREHLIASGISPKKITLLKNGVDDAFLAAGKSVMADRAENQGILFLGTWLPRKGSLDMTEAISVVLTRHPDAYFTVAGCLVEPSVVLNDFPEEVRSRIRVIQKLKESGEVIAAYKAHSIFLLPSYFEGYPLVMVEAAAMGLAIVTTDICGMRDFINSGEDGFLVPVADPGAIVACLDRLLSEPELKRRFGERIHQKSTETTWDTTTTTIEIAYEKAIQQKDMTNDS